jgi:tetratricopeptide (TPR) repeat protein
MEGALEKFQQYLEIHEKEAPESLAITDVHANASWILYETEKPDKALFHYQKCLEICEKEACDPFLVSEAHASIALIRDNNSQSEQALFHFRKCLTIEEKENPESPEVEDTLKRQAASFCDNT